MKIRLNGQPREVDAGTTLADVLRSLSLSAGVAIVVDRQVIPRSAHASTPVWEGAEIEVIRAVGGG